MSKSVSVVRGEGAAAAIAKRLREYPGNGVEWLQSHCSILKEDDLGVVALYQDGPLECVLKFYGYRSRAHQWAYRMGRGRAFHSYRAACALRREGIAVAQALGCLRLTDGMLLISEAIEGEGNLQEIWERGPVEKFARHVFQVAGHSMANLHRSGYAHGDCKWNNLLWDGGGIVMIDLDAVVRAPLHSQRQARDLARFTVNAEESDLGAPLFDLFLTSYLQVVGLTRQQAVDQMVPYVYAIRAKHLARYEPQGQRLV